MNNHISDNRVAKYMFKELFMDMKKWSVDMKIPFFWGIQTFWKENFK